MRLVTDRYELVTAAFSAELSQRNGVTAKIDIGVEKLIASAERTQDLVTPAALPRLNLGYMGLFDGISADTPPGALATEAFRRTHPNPNL